MFVYCFMYIFILSLCAWFLFFFIILQPNWSKFSFIHTFLSAILPHACFSIPSQSHFSTKQQSVRSDCRWCKLQIFFQCSLWPRCLYSQPAQQPPQSFSPNLITCFICTSLYFNQGWLHRQGSPARPYCSFALTRVSVLGLLTWDDVQEKYLPAAVR